MGEAVLRVSVLGPLRATTADGDVTPDGPLQRRLLALLVLRRGTVVTADTAIDSLWPEARPKDPAAALQTHLFRLRKALPDGVIESSGTGYRVDPTGVEVDADALADALASGEPAALDTIRSTLGRWHGPAYPELADDDDGRVEAGRLEELRAAARERLAEARLASGDTDGLVAELTALVDDDPLRERPRALLVEALHATGRTAEALRAYDDFRRPATNGPRRPRRPHRRRPRHRRPLPETWRGCPSTASRWRRPRSSAATTSPPRRWRWSTGPGS